MSFSIRLYSVKCLQESDEPSPSDEAFVLVTSATMGPITSGLPNVRTFRYGTWENFDEEDDPIIIGDKPFWGMDEDATNIANENDVCFIISMMEEDAIGKPDTYRGLAEAAAAASLLSTLTLPRQARVDRLLDAVKSAVSLPDADHVGTKELRLDGSDLIPEGSMKEKVLEIDGGDEGRWQLTFRIAHRRRNEFDQATNIAAVSRQSELMELWAVGGDGILRGNFFQDQRWQGWYMLAGELFQREAHLAAVSRHSNHMEVWAVGQDGMVRGIWYDGERWRKWYALPGAKFPAGSPLAVVSKHSEHMEIYGVDTDGIVRHTWFEDGKWRPENNWERLGGAQFPTVGVHLAAVSRNSDHMEVWVVGDHQAILGNRFDGTSSSPWGGWYPLEGEIFDPSTHLATVVKKDNNDMHVFAVDMHNHIRDFWFEGTTKRGWFEAGGATFNQGTPFAAVSRHPDRMELWAVGQDGIMLDDPAESQWQGWFPLGKDKKFGQKGHLAAVSRNEGHMEVWAVRQGEVISGNSFFDGSWHGWYDLVWSFEG
ncbi:MAG: hypothetical protein ACKVUS_05620 [Saprospiraceae bacterium]